MSDEAARDPAEEAPAPGPAPVPGPAGPEPTGDRRVDDALARLDGLAGTPVHAHVAVFEEIHQRLQELLVSADDPAPPGSASPESAPSRPGHRPPRPGPPAPGGAPGRPGPRPVPPAGSPGPRPWPGAGG